MEIERDSSFGQVLGKFRTIFYISLVYAAGQIAITLAAASPASGLPPL